MSFFFLIYLSGLDDKNCWSVDYVSRRICALQGLSVMIPSKYSHPDNQPPKSKLWYKISGKEEDGELIEAAGRVEYHDHVKNRHVLRIRNLKKTDSAEYRFSLQRGGKQETADLPGVTLVVTGTSSDYSYIFLIKGLTAHHVQHIYTIQLEFQDSQNLPSSTSAAL